MSPTHHHTTLQQVRHRVVVGQPLPFNVFGADRRLLLARGQVLETEPQLQALIRRGTLVDLAEVAALAAAVANPQDASAAELPALWQRSLERIGAVLGATAAEGFEQALDEAAEPLHALVRRDPDLAIFQVLRQEGNAHIQYGLRHSMHAAIVAQLVASRLGWSDDERARAVKAALTMNLGMLELHGQLAEQAAGPTPAQRRQIVEHPWRSREQLELAGVVDAEWLRGVEQHHEESDGSGYPAAIRNPCELATLLHRADTYIAKLSSRATREGQAADQAGREIFMQDPGHPVCAALVKEFGIYPPGCFVELASGETGVVVKRGPTVMTPIVAALTNGYGATLPEPVRRDTMMPLHAIVRVLLTSQMRASASPDRLVAVAA